MRQIFPAKVCVASRKDEMEAGAPEGRSLSEAEQQQTAAAERRARGFELRASSIGQ